VIVVKLTVPQSAMLRNRGAGNESFFKRRLRTQRRIDRGVGLEHDSVSKTSGRGDSRAGRFVETRVAAAPTAPVRSIRRRAN
jgi:hypothetical protein